MAHNCKECTDETARHFCKVGLWLNQAPSFNFELDEDKLLAKALAVGFVEKVGRDKYKLNEAYGGFANGLEELNP